MITIKKLTILEGKNKKTIEFGIANTPEELEKIFKLRFEEYSKRDYIFNERYQDKREVDFYDGLISTKYFCAFLEGKLIGTIRLITEKPLPTEQYFDFTPPDEIKNLPKEKLAELGRFIVIPPDRDKKIFLPRNVVLLFLIEVLVTYAKEQGLVGGYAFIKQSLIIKLKKLSAPIKQIPVYKMHYPDDGSLYKYFYQKENPVFPCYYVLEDFQKYLNKLIHSEWLFKKIGIGHFQLRSNLYTKFLKVFKVL